VRAAAGAFAGITLTEPSEPGAADSSKFPSLARQAAASPVVISHSGLPAVPRRAPSSQAVFPAEARGAGGSIVL
jgi:hypothetical protein